MIKRWIVLVILIITGSNFSFGQVLLLKKFDSGSANSVASRVELEITEWFFDQGIMILSEQNPTTEVEVELALYILQQVNAKALMLWSLDSSGTFHLMVYGLNGELWGEEKLRINLKEKEVEYDVVKKLLPLLQVIKDNFK